MLPAILDTDVLSQLLKQRHPVVLSHAASYFIEHQRFTISALTRYELARGLKLRGAARQLERFADFCRRSQILPITDAVLTRAEDIWVVGRRGGHSHRDADVLIAATALEADRTLVTANTAHFVWVPGLVLADWTQP